MDKQSQSISLHITFMDPAVDSRIKPPDVGIPMLQTKHEVGVARHNSSVE